MKKLIFICCLFIAAGAKAQGYNLHIGDSSFEVELGRSYRVDINGKPVNIRLSQSDTLKYSDDMFSFLYSKEYKVSETAISSSAKQITLLTADGSGIIIQKHTALNPTTLNSTMLNELTKKNIAYGYEEKRSDYKKTLRSGQAVEINRSVLTYGDKVYNYEVASLGHKDSGIIIITLLLSKDKSRGQKIIDLLWESLIFK